MFNFISMKYSALISTCVFSVLVSLHADYKGGPVSEHTVEKIVQLVQGNTYSRVYPNALPTLLKKISEQSTLNVSQDPIFIETFDDPVIFKHPFIYVNSTDRKDWTLSDGEIVALRKYLDRGGFIFIDAGNIASFLRGNASYGQFHSFAEWQVSPEVENAFKAVYPENQFRPLPRSHGIFRSYYAGLPDSSLLPDTVRDFVINEKWPQGTYAAMGLEVDGRLAVLALPIISMGWGQDEVGKWTSLISFRIRESGDGLSERLAIASYSGISYEVTREDGNTDIIYTQNQAMPSWVQEPDDYWRVFRYYHSQEISDYAHVFYTQLGFNIFTYAFTQ